MAREPTPSVVSAHERLGPRIARLPRAVAAAARALRGRSRVRARPARRRPRALDARLGGRRPRARRGQRGPADDVVVLCKERVRAAALEDRVQCVATPKAPYDAAVSAFDFDVASAKAQLGALREAIGPRGKIGVMLWGPPSE